MANSNTQRTADEFLAGKSEKTRELFYHFLREYNKICDVTLFPTKTMLGIQSNGKRIAWVTHLGKNFVHIVFPFKQPYPDNLCFQKIAQVPGNDLQFNHHFRMYENEDVNLDVLKFMKMAYLDL